MPIPISDGKTFFEMSKDPRTGYGRLVRIEDNLPEIAFDEARHEFYRVKIVKGQPKLERMEPTDDMLLGWSRRQNPAYQSDLKQDLMTRFNLTEERANKIVKDYVYANPIPNSPYTR